LAVLASYLPVEGQSLKKVLEVGEESFANRDYYSAYQCYNTLLRYPDRKIEEEEIYLKYRMALSAQRFNYFEMADSMYMEVLKMPEAENSIYEALATYNRAEVLYSMGTDEIETPDVINPAQPIEPRISDTVYLAAQQLFNTFLSDSLFQLLEGEAVQQRYKHAAEVYMTECDRLLMEEEETENQRVTRLVNPGINTTYSDLNPVILGDELYYSSLRHLPKPGKARRQSQTFSRVHRAQLPGKNPLDTGVTSALLQEKGLFNINEDVHTVHSAFSADQKQFFFSSCKQVGDSIICQVYRRWSLGDGQWGDPEKLSINIDSETITTTQPSVSLDCETGKEWLYFASNRDGSIGGLDIWRSEIEENGNLSPPEHLPEGEVNTRWDEATPFYHATSGRLYFSSDAPPGLGMYDIFYSQKQEDGTYAARVNLGLPINTGYNDQYFFLTEDGSRALFSSDRPRSMRFRENLNACCQDIYTYIKDIDMELEIELLSCVGNEAQTVADGTVRVYEEDCGQKVEVEGSPFKYEGQPLKVDAKRLKTYHIEAETADGSKEQMVLNLAAPDYEEESIAQASLNFFPKELAYQLQVNADVPANTSLEYKLLLEKDGTPIKEETYGPIHRFKLEEGSYRVVISGAYAIGDAGETQSAEYDSLIYNFNIAPYDQRRADYICEEKAEVTLVKRPPKLGFPIVFYFDNDKPDRLNGIADRSGQSYDEAYWDYIDSSRVNEYLEYNSNNPDGVATFIEENEVSPNPGQAQLIRQNPEFAKTIARRTLTTFFENEVEGQFNTFNNFMDGLIAYLANDNTQSLTIEIQGFCSPLGGSAYNKLLAQRRIECIRNYMTNYREGELEQYIDKKLFIKQEGVGVTQLFSNTPKSGKSAVYDYRALLARKVEIKDVAGDTFQITTTVE